MNSRLSILGILLASTATADDIVIYSSGQNGEKQSKVIGEIIDFKGDGLSILRPGGREQSIPASKVIKIESKWLPQHVAADKLFATRKFAEAHAKYREAEKNESREWVRRKIKARQVWCSSALGKIEQACTEWVTIFASDRTTQYFDAIPLAWETHEPTQQFQLRAKSWLDDGSVPVLNLIAASWLLSTSERSRALAELEALSSSADTRVAHLADAQRWRTELVTVKSNDVASWKKQVQRMPRLVRGGPSFMLGQAMSRLKMHEEAALTFMKVPIFHKLDHRLVGSSLHYAAGQLEQLGRASEAIGLYREVVSDYADVAVAAESNGRLIALTKPADK